MDNNTEELSMQEELSPEEAKAALGLSTRLSEQFMMSQVPQEGVEGSETPEKGSNSPVESKNEETPDKSIELEGKMDEKLEILRTEIKDTIKLEIEGIRNQIKEALDESDE